MIEIFHVSDLHLKGENDYNDRRVRTLLEQIIKRYPFSDNDDRYLLITGDFTQGGYEVEYNLTSEVLSQFPPKDRIFVTPGNHDWGCFFGTAYEDRKARYFDTPFASSLGFSHPFYDKRVFKRELKDKSGNSLIVIGLNSCTRGGVLQDWARGEIGESQRKELADILAKCSPKTPKLLFLHHIPNKEAEWAQFMTLMDWRQLMEVVRGKVDVLAFGHQGQLDIDYDKSLTWKALSRPMQVRSFERDHFTFEGGKPMTVLDANASVSELACYRITWDGLQPQPKAERVDFGQYIVD